MVYKKSESTLHTEQLAIKKENGKATFMKSNFVFTDQHNARLNRGIQPNKGRHTDNQCMILLIDTDQNQNTGWHGYDYMVNDYSKTATLYEDEIGSWNEKEKIDFAYAKYQLEISIPRNELSQDSNGISCDFEWTDNPKDLTSITSLFNDGDTAPNRRFMYRCIFKQH